MTVGTVLSIWAVVTVVTVMSLVTSIRWDTFTEKGRLGGDNSSEVIGSIDSIDSSESNASNGNNNRSTVRIPSENTILR